MANSKELTEQVMELHKKQTEEMKALEEQREEALKVEKYDEAAVELHNLPSSFNQKRTVTMTYENLLNMLEYRRGHKLDEWRMFCDWILTLPYGSLLKEGVGNEQS